MTPPPTHELDALLAHAGWMRALARGLARDPSLADDLVQDTWLAALEHAPPADAPVRAWLATVVRNFALQRRRSDARRARREELAARAEAQPSAHTTALGLALQQDLARRVLALAEPYRSTLYQRYYEGLPPREIARRAGVPVKTVKTRLTRALALLRAELDAAHDGDRTAWLSALVPFLGREQAAALYVGAVLMNLKLVLVLAGLAVCAALSLAYWQLADGPRESAAQAGVVARDAELVAPPLETNLARDVEIAERGAAAHAPAAPSALTVAPIAGHIRGRAIDVTGAPIGDVDVALESAWDARAGRAVGDNAPIAHTHADGSFELPANDGRVALVVADPDWITVRIARHFGTRELDFTRSKIVAARRNALAGVVVARDGAPVEAAEIWIEESDTWPRELGIPLDNAVPLYWKTHSDAQGRFELPDAPQLPGKLAVRSALHQPFEMPLPETPVPDLVITLTALEKPHVVVTGTVVDEHDRPVDGAHVAVGNRHLVTGADGAFRFDLTDRASGGSYAKLVDGVWQSDDDRAELRAVKTGHLPARYALPPFEELESAAPPGPIVLKLGGTPLTIRGRVLDHDGAPIAGVRVEVTTRTPFGQRRDDTGRGGATSLLEFETLMSDRDSYTNPARTDEHGAFEIAGLLDQAYDLFVHDETTLRHADLAGVRAGASAVEVRLPAAKELARVAGRVVGKDGEPIAGVDVRAGFALPGVTERMTKSVRTDERGQFEFAALAPEGLGFQVIGDHVFIVFWRTVEDGEDLQKLELVASRRAFVQLDATDHKGIADHFSAVDARGDPCRIMMFEGPAIFFPERADFDGEKSDVVAVEEDTRAIVLWKDGKEVARVPVKVVAEETVVVRP